MKNLDLLLKAAETMVERGIELNMGAYRSAVQNNITHPCGTSGCALGNMPFLGIAGLELVESDLTYCAIMGLRHTDVDWVGYEYRVFGLNGDDWDFLFSSTWDDLPEHCNQAEEFLGRVKILIANGGAPTDWSYTSVEDNEWLF